jgi:hypothetical protein
MRHLGSIILSLFLAPAIYVLVGVGTVFWTKSGDQISGVDYQKLGIAAGALVAAGALYAVLLLVRLSPLGPALAGLLLAGVAAWAKLATETFTDWMPRSILDQNFAGHVPAGPVAVVLGVGLIATLCSPRGWRKSAKPVDDDLLGGGDISSEDTLVYGSPGVYQPLDS